MKVLSDPYVAIAFNACLSVVIITSNILTLVAIATTPQLQTLSNLYIVSLACSDLLVGFTTIVLQVWLHPKTHVFFENSEGLCFFFKIMCYVSQFSSVLTIMLVTGDRFVYIKYPFLYERAVTEGRVKLVLGFSWVLSLAVGISLRLIVPTGYRGCDVNAVIFHSPTMGYIFATCFLCVLLVMSILHGIILRTALKLACSVDVPAATSAHRMNWTKVKPNLKLIKRVAGIFGMFFVCFAPLLIAGVIGPKHVNPDVTIACLFLSGMNSAWNFVIYALADSVFRAAMKRLVGVHVCMRWRGALTDQFPSA